MDHDRSRALSGDQRVPPSTHWEGGRQSGSEGGTAAASARTVGYESNITAWERLAELGKSGGEEDRGAVARKGGVDTRWLGPGRSLGDEGIEVVPVEPLDAVRPNLLEPFYLTQYIN